MSERGEWPLRPEDQEALPGMELEEFLDMTRLAQLMHESGHMRYDVIGCMTAQEIVDFVVALAGVEWPRQGSDARVARELIMDVPVLARRAVEAYDPEVFDALQPHERRTYTRVFNDYLHDVWLEPHRAEVETLAQVQDAATYQVGRNCRDAEWRAMRVHDTHLVLTISR